MKSRPFISIIVGTARNSLGSILADEQEHLFEQTIKTLSQQTAQEFELIVADSIYELRDLNEELQELSKKHKANFEIKVIPVTSWWLDEGMWALQAAFNQAAVASRGHHLMFCGDCCSFEPDMIEVAIELIDEGYSPHALNIKKTGGWIAGIDEQPISNATSYRDLKELGIYEKEHFAGDTRYTLMQSDFLGPVDCYWQWFYGYAFMSRLDFFSINGWDENFDGDKALGDVEMGSRLEMCGRFKMCLDKRLVAYEELHSQVNKDKFLVLPPIRSNFDLIWFMRLKGIVRGNITRYDETDLWRVIWGRYSGIHQWVLHPDHETSELYKYQRHWIDNQPQFVLEDWCAGI